MPRFVEEPTPQDREIQRLRAKLTRLDHAVEVLTAACKVTLSFLDDKGYGGDVYRVNLDAVKRGKEARKEPRP